MGASWGGSLGPAARKSVNESVTPASGNKTHAHRRARSRAAEGAGARAAAQPSLAVRAEEGFFPDNPIYKGILAPGKRSLRAERSKFLSAPSAARHPQNLQGPD